MPVDEPQPHTLVKVPFTTEVAPQATQSELRVTKIGAEKTRTKIARVPLLATSHVMSKDEAYRSPRTARNANSMRRGSSRSSAGKNSLRPRVDCWNNRNLSSGKSSAGKLNSSNICEIEPILRVSKPNRPPIVAQSMRNLTPNYGAQVRGSL